MTVSPADLGIPLGDDLDRVVEEQLRDITVAGSTYRFRPESHCKVCRNAELRERVEDLLASGTTYREILAIIRPANEIRKHRDRITYFSIREHADHFSVSRVGQIVYRRILERRAQEFNKNFVKGVGHTVTLHALLETVMVKGYAAVTDERIPITPELAISAGIKLYELESQDQGAAQTAEMIAKVARLQEAVYSVCSEEQIRAIDAALKPDDDDSIDAEWTEEDDEDDEDDNEFDPSTDMDESFTDTPDDF